MVGFLHSTVWVLWWLFRLFQFRRTYRVKAKEAFHCLFEIQLIFLLKNNTSNFNGGWMPTTLLENTSTILTHHYSIHSEGKRSLFPFTANRQTPFLQFSKRIRFLLYLFVLIPNHPVVPLTFSFSRRIVFVCELHSHSSLATTY